MQVVCSAPTPSILPIFEPPELLFNFPQTTMGEAGAEFPWIAQGELISVNAVPIKTILACKCFHNQTNSRELEEQTQYKQGCANKGWGELGDPQGRGAMRSMQK